jgi:hypothetical protein
MVCFPLWRARSISAALHVNHAAFAAGCSVVVNAIASTGSEVVGCLGVSVVSFSNDVQDRGLGGIAVTEPWNGRHEGRP